MLGNRGYGLRAVGRGTAAVATDVVIERTVKQACAVDACPAVGVGIGLASENGAALDVRRFRSSGNALVGALVASESSLDLHEGVVSRNRIGANVQVDGYDLDRLEDQVLYVENEANTDSTSIALPEPPEMLDLVSENR